MTGRTDWAGKVRALSGPESAVQVGPERLGKRSTICGFRELLAGCLLVAPATAVACEPIIPAAMVLSGGLFIIPSLVVLGVAVGLKACSFALFERRLTWWRAMLFIIAGNVVSTIIGVLLAFGAIVPVSALLSIVVVGLISALPCRRLTLHYPRSFGRYEPAMLTLGVMGLYVATAALFVFASELLNREVTGLPYWLLKFAAVFFAVGISIFLTTLWEEWIVSRMARDGGMTNFLPTVLKANLVTLLAITGYAAAMMLPRRLEARDFLVLMESVGRALGLVG